MCSFLMFYFRYVKVYLLPDKTKASKKKTKVKHKTLNPEWNDIIEVRYSTLCLLVTREKIDNFFKRNNKLTCNPERRGEKFIGAIKGNVE